MIVREIVRTCSNPHVARAAVASIGGDFARRFSSDAEKRNLTSGIFAAGLVRRFSRHAAEGDWEGVGEATRGADQPILSGLRYILERGVGIGPRRRRSRMGLARVQAIVLCRLRGIDKVGWTAGPPDRFVRSHDVAVRPALVRDAGAAHNASPCISGLTAEPPASRRF